MLVDLLDDGCGLGRQEEEGLDEAGVRDRSSRGDVGVATEEWLVPSCFTNLKY